MQKLALPVAVAALVCAVVAIFQAQSHSALAASSRTDKSDDKIWRSERAYPPLVFTSRAWLECSISSTKVGRQTLRTVSGQGFDFDMLMQPIKDGIVRVQAPGMFYKFNAFPGEKVPAT
jgi:flavin reductase (DIM6/NTAB) family NADH-FMN oxidoreductase RutF